MPRGSNQKREREFEHLKSKFEQSGRYKGREEEVAARIVNKQRARYGETKAEKQKDREGKSPDRGLPIRDYQKLTTREVTAKLRKLSPKQLRQVNRYEKQHKNRKGLLKEMETCLAE